MKSYFVFIRKAKNNKVHESVTDSIRINSTVCERKAVRKIFVSSAILFIKLINIFFISHSKIWNINQIFFRDKICYFFSIGFFSVFIILESFQLLFHDKVDLFHQFIGIGSNKEKFKFTTKSQSNIFYSFFTLPFLICNILFT